MTSWSLVALAAILCATVTTCWGLWLNATYSFDDEAPAGPDEQVTREWPNSP